jgi:hypothetical protein
VNKHCGGICKNKVTWNTNIQRMRKLKAFFFASILILSFACSDDQTGIFEKEQSLTGFWSYTRVLINGTDIEELTPGFEISNFLDLQEDGSYSKAYILGEWSLTNKGLALHEFTSSLSTPRYYSVIKHTKDILILETKMKKSEYNIGIPQFNDDDILTITEEFERIE